MKDFLEWTFQEVVENFEHFVPDYSQLNLDFDYDSET